MTEKFQEIIRIAGTNVDGTSKISYALTKIKGVGISLAKAIVNKAGLNPNVRIGFLSETEVEKIQNVMENLEKQDVPDWLLNRQKDIETGKSFHLIGSDIDLQVKSDVDRMMNLIVERLSPQLRVKGERAKDENHWKNPKIPRG